jgi:hypothetical protein
MPNPAGLTGYTAPGGKFYGIGNQVYHYLHETVLCPREGGKIGRYFSLNRQAFFIQQSGNRLDSLLNYFPNIYFFPAHINLAAFQLGQIKQIIDHPGQSERFTADYAAIFLHLQQNFSNLACLLGYSRFNNGHFILDKLGKP